MSSPYLRLVPRLLTVTELFGLEDDLATWIHTHETDDVCPVESK